MKRAKGIKIEDVEVGSGPLAEKGKIVLVRFHCYLNRGDVAFTSESDAYSHQIELGKRRCAVGLEQGIVGMREGGSRRISVGPQLTYYERRAHPEIPADAVLRYEVELVRVSDEWDNVIYESSAGDLEDP